MKNNTNKNINHETNFVIDCRVAYTQVNNKSNPMSACQVTSAISCLSYLGANFSKFEGVMQPEDALYKFGNKPKYKTMQRIKEVPPVEEHNTLRLIIRDFAREELNMDILDNFRVTSKQGFLSMVRQMEHNKNLVLMVSIRVDHHIFGKISHVVHVEGWKNNCLLIRDPLGDYRFDYRLIPQAKTRVGIRIPIQEEKLSTYLKPGKNRFWFHELRGFK